MQKISRPTDTSICGSLEYLVKHLGNYGVDANQSTGVILADRGFQEHAFQAGNRDAYYNGLIFSLQSSLRHLVSDMKPERLRKQVKSAESHVKELEMRDRDYKYPTLGSIIYIVLNKNEVTRENFDEKARDILSKIGMLSFRGAVTASHEKRGDNRRQYAYMLGQLIKEFSLGTNINKYISY
ncbi:hypothetical protein HYX18_01875 [Candidatus Woesearchaeota archaeon]|nr:hypothetical protein [Candidatus Woesearchaeota archaeon]